MKTSYCLLLSLTGFFLSSSAFSEGTKDTSVRTGDGDIDVTVEGSFSAISEEDGPRIPVEGSFSAISEEDGPPLRIEKEGVKTTEHRIQYLIWDLSHSSPDERQTARHLLRQKMKVLKYMADKPFLKKPLDSPPTKNPHVQMWAETEWTPDIQKLLFDTAFNGAHESYVSSTVPSAQPKTTFNNEPDSYGQQKVTQGILLTVAKTEPTLIEPPLEENLLQVALYHPYDKKSQTARRILAHIRQLTDRSQQIAVKALLQSVQDPLLKERLIERVGRVLLNTRLSVFAEKELVQFLYHKDPGLSRAAYRILKSKVHNNPAISLARSETYKRVKFISLSDVSNRQLLMENLEILAESLSNPGYPKKDRKKVAQLIENNFEFRTAGRDMYEVETILIKWIRHPFLDKWEKELISGILLKKARWISIRAQIQLAQLFHDQPSLRVGRILEKVPTVHESVRQELLPFIQGSDRNPYRQLVFSILKEKHGFLKSCVLAFR